MTDADPSTWRAAMELDLLAPMALTQLLLPGLRRVRGAVVNVASSTGVETTAYSSPEYGAAKAGLVRFTTSVADWRERYGVRVNCVVPGWVGLERAHDELATRSADERAATPALVPPEMIAGQVLRLLRDEFALWQSGDDARGWSRSRPAALTRRVWLQGERAAERVEPWRGDRRTALPGAESLP